MEIIINYNDVLVKMLASDRQMNANCCCGNSIR